MCSSHRDAGGGSIRGQAGHGHCRLHGDGNQLISKSWSIQLQALHFWAAISSSLDGVELVTSRTNEWRSCVYLRPRKWENCVNVNTHRTFWFIACRLWLVVAKTLQIGLTCPCLWFSAAAEHKAQCEVLQPLPGISGLSWYAVEKVDILWVSSSHNPAVQFKAYSDISIEVFCVILLFHFSMTPQPVREINLKGVYRAQLHWDCPADTNHYQEVN